jgi:RHS repeat-associated protein
MVALAEDKISPADVVDAVNRRLRKNVSNGGLPINIPNGTIDCIWFGWQAMEERNPFGGTGSTDTPIRQYVWGQYIDECIQLTTLGDLGPQSTPAGAYYLLQDLLFRAVALSNSTSGIVEAYDMDAYGNTLIFTGPGADGVWFTDDDVQSDYGANEIIYCGYRFDPETQLYYVRNRTYSPPLGRWLQRDPIGYSGGVNLYGYLGGRAVAVTDPSGLLALQGTLFSAEAYEGFGGGVDVAYSVNRDKCPCNPNGYGRLSGSLGVTVHLGLGIGEGLDILGYHEELLLKLGPQISFGDTFAISKGCHGKLHMVEKSTHHVAPIELSGSISIAKVFSLTAFGQIGGSFTDTISVTDTSIEVKLTAELNLGLGAHLQIGFFSWQYTLPAIKRPGINESATIFDHK